MHRKSCAILLAGLMLVAGCGPSPAPQQQSQAKPATPAVPPAMLSVAQALLGSEAEVLAWGDLAHTGTHHVLAANRLKIAQADTEPGTLVTRVAMASQEGGRWTEVFRCDEHLKNPKGFLEGTPATPVAGWRLRFEQDPEKGLVMYFTPLQQPVRGVVRTICVRWNPKVQRYQSMDKNYERFLGEVPALDKIRLDSLG